MDVAVVWIYDPADSNATCESWDKAVMARTIRFRGQCALALARGGRREAAEALSALLQELVPVVIREYAEYEPENEILSGFQDICAAMIMLGRKEGVDAFIAVLPSTYGERKTAHNEWECARDFLGRTVGDRFDLAPDLPKHLYEKAVRQWEDWWRANRDGLSFEEVKKKPEDKSGEHCAEESMSTRDLVAAIEDYGNGLAPRPRAEAVLKKRCARNCRELKAVAENPGERLDVRAKATEFYIHFKGKKGLGLVTRLLDAPDIDVADDSYGSSIYGLCLTLTHDYPDKFKQICRDRILEGGVGTAMAVRLLINQEDYGFLRDHYTAVVTRVPEMSSEVLYWLVIKSLVPDAETLTKEIQGADFWKAMLAAECIRRQCLEKKLPEEARAALKRWQENPAFRMMVASHGLEKEQHKAGAAQILPTIQGNDCAAARAYGIALRLLTNDLDDLMTPEAATCIEHLRKCIQVYLAQLSQ